MSSKIPRGVLLPAETKKTAQKLDTAAVSVATNAAQKSDGVLKVQKENQLRKNVAPKVHKGISTRYGQQAELKEQNVNLMSVNEELQKNLAETQERVSELELQFRELEKEKAEAQRSLKDCHVLLVAAKIDPVLGREVGEDAQQDEEQRRDAMGVSSDLLAELRTFGDMASQQRARLEEIQTTMRNLAEARQRTAREREDFSLRAAELEKALEEGEALLL